MVFYLSVHRIKNGSKLQVGFDPIFDPIPKDREAKSVNRLRRGSKTNV